MPLIDLGEIKMYYKECGEGVPIICLHGFSLDHRQWRSQASFFSDSYRVITPDARGHGQSDAPETGYGRANRVEDLAKLVDKLKIDRFHLVGLSMGGSTAIGYALEHQARLLSLSLVSTAAAGYNVSKKFSKLDQLARERGVDAALVKWMTWSLAWYKGRREDIGKEMSVMMDGFSGRIWSDPMRGKYPRTNDLERVHEITAPTAIFAGELDKVFVSLAGELHHRIKGSRLSIYEGTGHMLNIEAPDRFNRELAAFLEVNG